MLGIHPLGLGVSAAGLMRLIAVLLVSLVAASALLAIPIGAQVAHHGSPVPTGSSGLHTDSGPVGPVITTQAQSICNNVLTCHVANVAVTNKEFVIIAAESSSTGTYTFAAHGLTLNTLTSEASTTAVYADYVAPPTGTYTFYVNVSSTNYYIAQVFAVTTDTVSEQGATLSGAAAIAGGNGASWSSSGSFQPYDLNLVLSAVGVGTAITPSGPGMAAAQVDTTSVNVVTGASQDALYPQGGSYAFGASWSGANFYAVIFIPFHYTGTAPTTAPTGFSCQMTTNNALTLYWPKQGNIWYPSGYTIEQFNTPTTTIIASTVAPNYNATYWNFYIVGSVGGSLQADTFYWFIIRDTNGSSGPSPYTSPYLECATVVAPTDLFAAAASSTSAVLTWTQAWPSGNVSNDTVGYGTTFGSYTIMVSAGAVNNTTVTGLSAGHTYYFVVWAWVSHPPALLIRLNPSTNVAVVSTPVPSTVVLPPVLTAAGASGTTVVVSWSAAVNVTVSNYTLERGTAYGTYGTHTSEGASTFEAAVTGLAQNTTYFFIVYAGTGASYTAVGSNVVSAHTLSNAPGVPVPPILSAAGTSGTTAVVAWSAPVNDSAANYTLERGTTYGVINNWTSETLGTSEVAVVGLAQNTTYFFFLQVWKGSAVMAPLSSNTAPAHTLVNPPAPLKVVLPPVLTATGIGTTSVAVSWGAAANVTVTNYTLEYGTSYGAYPTHVSEGASAFETVVTGLGVNATYWFRLYAGTAASYAAIVSNVVSARTLSNGSLPSFPVVTAAAVNETGITVSWHAPPGHVANYTLMYARFYGLPIAYISVGNKTVYNLSLLGFGLTYYFTVWAWANATSEGPPSNVAAAQTDVPAPPAPPFPWSTLTTITTLSILGSVAVSFALLGIVDGRRRKRTQGAATIALARSRRQGEANYPANRSPPPSTRSYSAIPRRRQGP